MSNLFLTDHSSLPVVHHAQMMGAKCSIRLDVLIVYSYLLRGEMIGLHEGEVSYTANPRRGAQFYPDCVQIQVTGEGTVELPEGTASLST